MATRFINATVGSKDGDGKYSATANHAAAGASHVQVSIDDTQITTLSKLKATLDAVYQAAQGNKFFTP